MAEEYRILARADMERKIRSRIEMQRALEDDLEGKRRRREQEQREEEVSTSREMTILH